MNWSSCTESLPSSDMYPAGRATQFSGVVGEAGAVEHAYLLDRLGCGG